MQLLCYIGAKYHIVITRKLNLFLRKSIKLLPPELLLWPRYAPNRLSAGASPQTLLGELTALPQTPYGLRGPTSKGRGGKGKEGEEKGIEGGGEGRAFRLSSG